MTTPPSKSSRPILVLVVIAAALVGLAAYLWVVPELKRKDTPELFAQLGETSIDVSRLQVQLYARELSSPSVELTRDGDKWPYTRE